MKILTPRVECIGSVKAMLGESVFWSARDEALLWVDIVGCKVLRTALGTGHTEQWQFPEQVGFVQPADDGMLLVGQENSILWLDTRTGTYDLFIAMEPDDPSTRTNDAGCDPLGRLLVGTMHMAGGDDWRPAGSLYWIDGKGDAATLDSGLFIPNGIAFNPAGEMLYWAETHYASRQVWCADHNPVTGETSAKRPFVQIDAALGRPDGAAVDAEGFYWVAAVWGWQLLRYAPNGRLDLVVRLPVQRPSKLAFGGSDLGTIFVTSISEGLADDAEQTQPLSGRLLAFDIGIYGLLPHSFRRCS